MPCWKTGLQKEICNYTFRNWNIINNIVWKKYDYFSYKIFATWFASIFEYNWINVKYSYLFEFFILFSERYYHKQYWNLWKYDWIFFHASCFSEKRKNWTRNRKKNLFKVSISSVFHLEYFCWVFFMKVWKISSRIKWAMKKFSRMKIIYYLWSESMEKF